jgi:hypothetical protein
MSAKSEMASDGYMSKTIRKSIVNAFGLSDCLFALTSVNAVPTATRKDDENLKNSRITRLMSNVLLS